MALRLNNALEILLRPWSNIRQLPVILMRVIVVSWLLDLNIGTYMHDRVCCWGEVRWCCRALTYYHSEPWRIIITIAAKRNFDLLSNTGTHVGTGLLGSTRLLECNRSYRRAATYDVEGCDWWGTPTQFIAQSYVGPEDLQKSVDATAWINQWWGSSF